MRAVLITRKIVPGMSGAYHTSSLVARRDILPRSPDFYRVASEYGFGDYPDALWLRLHGKIHYLDRCMSVYRLNSNESAWSSGVAGQYGKLRQFIVGKAEMLRAFRPWAPEEVLPLVDRTILEREFELMYIEGRDAEQRKAPYDKLLRAHAAELSGQEPCQIRPPRRTAPVPQYARLQGLNNRFREYSLLWIKSNPLSPISSGG